MRHIIHQFHYTAAPADAVTSHMLFLQKCLRDAQVQGTVFAQKIKGLKRATVQGWDRQKLSQCDLLLIHHSHGNPRLRELLEVDAPKAIVYHNITPERFYTHDPHMFHMSELGRRQLRNFTGKMRALFTVSQYNAAELRSITPGKVTLIPLLDLNQEEPQRPHAKGKQVDSRHLLFVGRLTPHKNQALLVKTLFYLNRQKKGSYHLNLVGGGDPVYTHYLKLLAKALGIEAQVEFHGTIDHRALADCYHRADAFVCVSLHEGFCLPVVEAMRAGVPVFALPLTGTEDTLGRGGIHVHTQSAYEIAGIISTVLDNERAVACVRASQEKRLRQLRKVHNASGAQRVLLDLLGVVRKGESQSSGRGTHAPKENFGRTR